MKRYEKVVTSYGGSRDEWIDAGECFDTVDYVDGFIYLYAESESFLRNIYVNIWI